MRAPHRDRRGPALAALCAALVTVLLAAPCAALYAEYRVLENGTAYNASVEITDADRFEFYELGVLGERIPVRAGSIGLTGACSPCLYNTSGASAITFAKGNYTVFYTAPLRDFHLQAAFERPYRVNVTVPPEFGVSNPLLAGISPGAAVSREYDNSTTISWNRTTAVDLRFYDQGREDLLYLFGNFWIVIAVVLLMPFLLTRKGRT